MRKAAAVTGVEHDDRHDDQRQHHDAALHEVGEADREKATDHRVGKDDAQGQPDTGLIAAVKGRGEQLAAGNQAGGGVDREEHHDDQRRDQAQRACLRREALAEEFRDGQGVVIALGLLAQPRGDDDPVDQRTDEKSDPDPGLNETADVERTGQAEKQPARHVRCTG